MRSTSERGIALIQQYESLRLDAYRDGGGVWTIGWGHTALARPGMVITRAEAERLLRGDLETAEREVAKRVTVPLNQSQFDALVSFEFNTGGLVLRGSKGQPQDSTLLTLLNTGDYIGAAAEFAKWHRDNGKRVKGLLRRRAAEMVLFLTD
jgi:lysozyme